MLCALEAALLLWFEINVCSSRGGWCCYGSLRHGVQFTCVANGPAIRIGSRSAQLARLKMASLLGLAVKTRSSQVLEMARLLPLVLAVKVTSPC